MRRLRFNISLFTMSENINQTGAVTRKMVNMNISEDVSFWLAKWGITREQLQNAVDRVGGKETRVSDYLRAKGIIRF
jgi:Protein of unknown function (DUF3606)